MEEGSLIPTEFVINTNDYLFKGDFYSVGN